MNGVEVTMECEFEQFQCVGVFTFCGDLTHESEDDLKMILMKAIHGIDRAVLNFKKVKKIDLKCLHLIRQAYHTSVRLKNPLILTSMPKDCLPELSGRAVRDKEGKGSYLYAGNEPPDNITKKTVYH